MEKMHLVLNGYGTAVRKRSGRIVVESGGECQEFAADDIDQIVVAGAATITSDVAILAAERGIDIAVLRPDGMPAGRFVSCGPCGTVLTRKNQVVHAQGAAGHLLCVKILGAKIAHMGGLIAALGRNRGDGALGDEGDRIAAIGEKMPFEGVLPASAPALRAVEAEASRRYFAALAGVLDPAVYGGTRQHRPAADVFNASLNYGYGILYNEVERACLTAGLDPYVGFLHADRAGSRSFVYDVIEQFRQPVVDRAVITLAVRGRIGRGDLDGGGYLTQEARRTVAATVIDRLTADREIAGVQTTFSGAITANMRDIVRFLNEDRPYRPFLYRWR
jgi:CRISPR-associated protein Cas1